VFPQEQSIPLIPRGSGLPLCRLLPLAGPRWRYSSPPPHGSACSTGISNGNRILDSTKNPSEFSRILKKVLGIVVCSSFDITRTAEKTMPSPNAGLCETGLHSYRQHTRYTPCSDRGHHRLDMTEGHIKGNFLNNVSRLLSSHTTRTAQKTMPAIIHSNGNVFTALLPSNDRADTETRHETYPSNNSSVVACVFVTAVMFYRTN
jgi:hypothetical protein